MRDTDFGSDVARIADIAPRTAGARLAHSRAMIVELQRHPNYILSPLP